MDSSFLYVIAVESASLNFEILLNDVPVGPAPDRRPVNSQRNVNQWIVEGTNVLEIRLGLPSDGDPEHSRSFQLRLFGGEHGKVPDSKDALIEFVWDAAAQPLGEPLATVFTNEFQPEISFGRWRWQDCPASALTESDKQELVQLIRKAHRAFSEKDVGAVAELLKLLSAEMARAVDIEEEELVMGQSHFFKSLFESDGCKFDPLEESTLVFTPVASGRLVKVTQAGGEPLLRGKNGEGSQYASTFIFGKVAGAWHILRSGS
jgi:hypothetical protein